jgi:hypothetical protein
MGRIGISIRKWTAKDNALLQELALTRTSAEIGARLGRSGQAVRSHASLAGISLHSESKRFGWERAKTLHATRRPTIRDLEWAAGFLEGEGCWLRAGKAGFQSGAKQIATREPLDRLVALFGGAIYAVSHARNRSAGGKGKDGWEWRACGARGRGVAMTLYPLLSQRRQSQIRGALA